LIAERLSSPGRHDKQDITALRGSTAYGFLIGAEAGEAESPVEEI
jgi:hypothetical protein